MEIEVFSTLGNSQFAIVGLPDQAVKEAKDRIPTALKSQGLSSRKELDVTVNLAPADVKKEGPVYDLPIAVGLLKATGKVFSESLGDYAFAKSAKASSARNPRPYNEASAKYDLRVFLLRLGWIGEMFKAPRKHLLKRMPGSAAWKDGRHD